MRIGFDSSQTGAARAGCGWYARSLIEHVAASNPDSTYVLYPSFGDHYWSPAAGRDTCQPTRRNVVRGPRQRSLEAMRRFWTDPPADWFERLGRPQIIHSNNFFCPVAFEGPRLVYTLYDLSFLHHPDWSTEENRVACFRGVYDASLFADVVVTISEFSRNDFLQSFPHFPSERVAVVPPASRFRNGENSRAPTPVAGLAPGAFWLHVGTDEPRKNRSHLLAAYAALCADHRRPMPLVLAGGQGWLSDGHRDQLDSLGGGGDVRNLGYVADRELEWLYRNCFAFIFPSHYEGFGMPVLEAMQAGAAVIASRTTSIPEITGDAAILIDPADPSTTTSAMGSLIDDPHRRAALRERGPQRAQLFSWDDSARKLVAAYRKALQLAARAR